jgi:hypothetical protein
LEPSSLLAHVQAGAGAHGGKHGGLQTVGDDLRHRMDAYEVIYRKVENWPQEETVLVINQYAL